MFIYFVQKIKLFIKIILLFIKGIFLSYLFIKYIKSVPLLILTILKNEKVFDIRNDRIGHFVMNIFLSSQLFKGKKIFYYIKGFEHPNKYLKKKLNENYNFDQKYEKVHKLMQILNFITMGLYKCSQPVEQMRMTSKYDFSKCFNGKKQIFEFNENENNQGLQYLKDNNINPNKFICLLIRSKDYLKGIGRVSDEISNFRNVNPNIFLPSIKYLLSIGYTIIRMGKHHNNQLPIEHENFHDYAVSNKRDDFLDIWLSAKCNFFLASGSGLGDIPSLFNKPRFTTCIFPIGHMQSWVPNHIYLFRHAKKNGKFLTIKEQIELGIIREMHSVILNKQKIEITETDPNDILLAIMEFEKIYKKKIIVDQENIALWKNIKNHWDNELLKKNQNLKHSTNFDVYHKIEGISCQVPNFYLKKYSKYLF